MFKFKAKFNLKLYIIIFIFFLIIHKKKKTKKIGVIGLSHGNNIGNNLLKYAMHIKLTELGFEPYIIGFHKKLTDISFINKTTNLRIIKKSFKEIKRNDYDILMVNSDQTWRPKKNRKHFYDIGFLCFAKSWKITKFVYSASIRIDYWNLTKKDEKIVKECLRNFSDISLREKGSIKLVENHLGIKAKYTLDPTLLIDKKYYLNIINHFKIDKMKNENFIFTYTFLHEEYTKNFIEIASKKLGYNIYNVKKKYKNSIEKFLYGVVNCKAVITNSFHGTVFSIIFNKPFVSFIFKNSPRERLNSLKKIFKVENRIFEYNQIPDVNLLTTPLNINNKLMNSLKIRSINYLKKNLGII
jgi:hypothetical protein